MYFLNNTNIYISDIDNHSVFALFENLTTQLGYDQENSTEKLQTTSTSWLSAGRIQIPLYTVILLLAIVGNLLVITTLMQNSRLRTITNLFLLNLAFSDILLGVLCMPFTLVGTLLRDFVFGEFLCKLIPFLQATSVAVSSWTLVAISCERYYAICHPLRSRSWQTIRHAYKIIGFIWFGSLFCMSPIAGVSQLIPTSQGSRKKCREQWPLNTMYNTERAYNIFLDIILLVVPLIILCAAYILITRTLWMGIRAERSSSSLRTTTSNEENKNNLSTTFSISLTVQLQHCPEKIEENNCYDNQIIHQHHHHHHNHSCNRRHHSHSFSAKAAHRTFPSISTTTTTTTTNTTPPPASKNGRKFLRSASMKFFEKKSTNIDCNNGKSTTLNNQSTSTSLHPSPITQAAPVPVLRKQFDSILRRSNVAKNLENKQRVIRMLFVLVLEFFICWTPLYVINTIVLFNPMLIYQNLGYTAITYFQLLAYSSSCCNPITYCFMNASFRRAFLDTTKNLKLTKLLCCIQKKYRLSVSPALNNRKEMNNSNSGK